ncbi:MAG: purine-nucleoside phosphorylase [Elusimicrobiota bacterium]
MEIKTYIHTVRRAAQYLRANAPGFRPDVAIILGSGLKGAVPELHKTKAIDYARIPGFPRTTVKGHTGRLVMGQLRGLSVAVLQGRFHYYEGHPMESIVLPLRVLEYLGLKTVIITAAVGSLNKRLKPGHVAVLKDHMNFMGRNPLRGFHEEEFGEMFPDMAEAYTPSLRKLALAECRRLRIPAREGVYVAVGGPSYETPAEIRAFQKLGADVVGMSTVPEVIAARQMGLRILGLSWISNMGAGISKEVLSHPDVLALGDRVAEHLRRLLTAVLVRLGSPKR